MNTLAQPVISADQYPPLLLRSPRVELPKGYALYQSGQPLEACDGFIQRMGWWQAERDEAMAATKVNTKGLN